MTHPARAPGGADRRPASLVALALACLPACASATVSMDCASADGAYLVTIEMQAAVPARGDGLGALLVTTPGHGAGTWTPFGHRVFDPGGHHVDIRARPRVAGPGGRAAQVLRLEADDAGGTLFLDGPHAVACGWDQVG